LSIVLTQPLGIGVLFAGLMQTKARGVDVDTALSHMLKSNAQAASVCRVHGMTYCTDVTGFGLLGHLQRLVETEELSCTVNVRDLPVFNGVEELVSQGVQSSLSKSNQSALDFVNDCELLSEVDRIIMCDPQTAGGLLAFVPSNQAISCIESLHLSGFDSATVIGLARSVRDISDMSAAITLS